MTRPSVRRFMAALNPPPPWLRDVAVEVDELVQDPRVRALFQKKLQEWAQSKPWRDRDEGVRLLANRAMKPSEQ